MSAASRLEFRPEGAGVCNGRETGVSMLYQRGQVFKSRKYRVWPVAGDDRFVELDPDEFQQRFKTVEFYLMRKRPNG
jgi:hypothetical protein